jgi:hypothetical protein
MVELFFLAALCGLAVWRLTSLLHTEDAFEWLRRWIGIRNDDKGYPTIYPETFWGALFDCFWCLSLVVAVPIATMVYSVWDLGADGFLLIWFASSAVAIYWEKQIMRTQSR